MPEESSYFFGEKVPLNTSGVSLLSETVSGYTVNSKYKKSSDDIWTDFNSQDNLSVESKVKYDFYYEIILPEVISKNTTFNQIIKFWFQNINSFGDIKINYVRGNWDDYFSEVPEWEIDGQIVRLMSKSDITATYDVNRICIYMYDVKTTNTVMYMQMMSVDISESSTNGLLSGIIGWIKNIYNSITDLPSNIASAIKGFFDMVASAITDLGEFLIDGIKGLFLPTDAQIQEYIDLWDELIQDRFGALYDCFTIVKEFSEKLVYSGNQTEIEFPSVSVDLAGTEFVYGGWTVKVVPDGFSFLIDSIKLIVNIVCTLLFVNGMKNRLEYLYYN